MQFTLRVWRFNIKHKINESTWGLSLKPHKHVHLFNFYTPKTKEGKVTHLNDFKNKIIWLSSATLFTRNCMSPSSWIYAPWDGACLLCSLLSCLSSLFVSATMWLILKKEEKKKKNWFMGEMESLLGLLSGDMDSSLNTVVSYCLALGYL